MPDSGKNAIKTHAGNGSEVDFEITFGYSERDDITVTVAGVTQLRPAAWDFKALVPPGASTHITFVSAPVNLAVIVITRSTDHPAPNVTFTDGAPIQASNLADVSNQVRYYIEEVEDLT
jgi:hypothetical protein